MPKPLLFSYLAFSTGKQADGRSPERQDGGAAAFAKANGFAFARSRQYRDEGVSRYNGKARRRGALSRFLQLCGTPSVPPGSVLWIEDFDRLSRETPDDAWELFRGILLTGVEIYVETLARWFKRDALNRIEDRVIVMTCQDRAHRESAVKAGRIRDKWAKRREASGEGEENATVLPSWVERAQGGALVPIADRVRTIRTIATLAMQGAGKRTIAQRLNRGPEAVPCWLKAGEWNQSNIGSLLTGNAIWGAYQRTRLDEKRRRIPVGEVVRGFYPAVLTEQEAADVRRALKGRSSGAGRRAKRDRNVLRGIVRDAETGATLHLRGGSPQRPYDYLARPWQGTSQVVAPFGAVRQLVLRAVQKWAPDALAVRDREADRAGMADQLAQLAAIAADRAAIRAQLDKPGRAASTVAMLADQLDQLDAREAGIKEALADLEANADGVPPSVLTACQALAEAYEGMSADEREEAGPRLNARLQDVLEGVWLCRRNFSPHTAELILQVWPRAGEPTEWRMFIGQPPEDYRPLDTAGADFRKGFRPGQSVGSIPKKGRKVSGGM